MWLGHRGDGVVWWCGATGGVARHKHAKFHLREARRRFFLLNESMCVIQKSIVALAL